MVTLYTFSLRLLSCFFVFLPKLLRPFPLLLLQLLRLLSLHLPQVLQLFSLRVVPHDSAMLVVEVLPEGGIQNILLIGSLITVSIR